MLISKCQIWVKIQIACFSVKCPLHVVAFRDSYLEALRDPVEQSVTLGLSVRKSGARAKLGERSLRAAEFICWWYWRKVRTRMTHLYWGGCHSCFSQKMPHSKFNGHSWTTFGDGAIQPYSTGQDFCLMQSPAFQSPFQKKLMLSIQQRGWRDDAISRSSCCWKQLPAYHLRLPGFLFLWITPSHTASKCLWLTSSYNPFIKNLTF